MARYVLEILDGDRAGSVIPLGEDPVRIGRRGENHVVLADEKVSGKHAEVVFEDGRHVLRDLESTNGTLMDGRRVEEVVLTGQDQFQIGRVQISYHLEGEEPGMDLRLHRVSAETLSRSARSSRSLVVLIAVLAVVGGALYYNLNVGPGPMSVQERRPLTVSGNRVPQDVASLEGGDGWDLQAAGDGFQYGPRANTGRGALEARWMEVGEGFALVRLSEPAQVRGSLMVTGYLRTEGTARVAMRLRFSSSFEEETLTLTTGTEPRSYERYQRVEWGVAVPSLMDLAELEVLALTPDVGDAAFADDLSILEAGESEPIDLRAGGQVIGTGSSFAVRLLGDPVVLSARPIVEEGPLVPVAAAGLATLSDAGVSLRATAGERAVTIQLAGRTGLVLDLPLESAPGMLLRSGGEPFRRRELPGTADEILISAANGRLLLGLPEAQSVRGLEREGRFELMLPQAAELRIQMSFPDEIALAARELSRARAVEGSNPKEALDHLQKILDDYPHDVGMMRQAMELRANLVARRDQRTEELRASLETAMFFRTRGGFLRMREDLDELESDYGEHIEQRASIDVMRAQVDEALQILDEESARAHRERLEALAGILEENGQAELAKMVRDYLGR